MKLRLRRTLVAFGVVASVIAGIASIQVAGSLAAAAAPPTAPPISMAALKGQLEAEQVRSAALQEQLNALLEVSNSLSAALDSTSDQVSTDGLTADQLRQRLIAAQNKLASITALLEAAQKRLASLQGASTGGGGSGGSGGTSGSGATSAPGGGGPTAAPAPPAASFTATLVSGGVQLSWPTCTASGFASYAIVRSKDSEVHYPPEDLDTVVATITSAATTTVTDPVASGTYWYQVYCRTNAGGEARTASKTAILKVTVP